MAKWTTSPALNPAIVNANVVPAALDAGVIRRLAPVRRAQPPRLKDKGEEEKRAPGRCEGRLPGNPPDPRGAPRGAGERAPDPRRPPPPRAGCGFPPSAARPRGVFGGNPPRQSPV